MNLEFNDHNYNTYISHTPQFLSHVHRYLNVLTSGYNLFPAETKQRGENSRSWFSIDVVLSLEDDTQMFKHRQK